MNETIASGSRRARATVLLATILVAWSSLPAAAQSPAPRIRVGLALGGGSARGFAHIGVLQWFEEHRIPIDVVGGTSMGGLIGGAYASGMSPQEIRALVDSLDWSAVLAPDTPFVFKTFRRKEDARAFPSQLNFGLKGGLKLPSGLSPGAQVDLLFDRIAAPYPTDISFNDLPTPFRCVAADLRTARAVVFDAGWLARALRSTMAIPGVFSPVHVDGKVLVDGGVLNNVPADVVKATGLADTVIAVDVGEDLSHEKRSDTIFAVLGETLDVMMRAATRLALQSASLVLVPDLKGFESTDFARADGFVRKGYAAAEAHAAELQRFALSEPDYAAWAAARRARRRTALPAPTFIAVEGVSTLEAAEIQRRLASSLNKPFDADRVDAELTKLTGAGRYEAASYRFEIRDERPGLVVSIRPKSNGPPFLLVGLDLQNTQSSDVTATIRGRVVLFDVVGTGSEGRIDVSLGTTLAASAELYRPVGRTGLFVASPRHASGRAGCRASMARSSTRWRRQSTMARPARRFPKAGSTGRPRCGATSSRRISWRRTALPRRNRTTCGPAKHGCPGSTPSAAGAGCS
ncbi:MAG: patatin-like phospholipase family protein [Acidobacteria bacterium]|nr:patatin-like phospholipase family protein [Acidobacteriota bacterium]